MYNAMHKQKMIKYVLAALFICTALLAGLNFAPVVKASGNTYYVSQSTGNDNNPGTQAQPWKTLTKVSSMTFNGGDTVLLKRGDTWTGESLYLKASGATHQNWATLSSYGSASDARPKIHPGSGIKWSIKMENVDNNDYNCGWKILNMEVAYAKVGIAAIDYRENAHVQENSLYGLWIENCYIHHITGLAEEEDYFVPFSSAIQTNAAGSRCRDYTTIKDTVIENCDMGISLKWVWNFLIDNVTTNYMGLSGIDLTTAINGTIQNCRILNSGQSGYRMGTCAVGFMHSVSDVVMKDSEVAYTISPNSVDGCAIDFEGASSNVTVQNCYIHDNAARAFLIMATGGDCSNSNVLNNVCINNGWDNDPEVEPAFLLIFGNTNNGGTIAGNTITKAYSSQSLNRIEHTYTEGYPTGFNCYNNTISTNTNPPVTPTPAPVTPAPTDAPEVTPTPTTPPSTASYTWSFENGTDGWYAWDVDGISSLYAANGYLNGTVTNSDPFMRSGNNLNINIDNITSITIRMKNSTAGSYGEFYFITSADGNWGGQKQKSFSLVQNDSGYTTYTVDMTEVSGWSGTLLQLRLDPSNGAPSGSFSIDYITLNSSSSGEPEVTPTPTPTATPTEAPVVTPTPTPTPTTPPSSSSYTWGFDSSTDGWYAWDVDGITNLYAANGYLNGTVTNSDPFMRSAYGLNINIDNVTSITIRMKNSTAGSYGEFYFITSADGNWGGQKQKSFSLVQNDSGYTTYTVDMTEVPGWSGTLLQLRLDPSNGAPSGSFSIDYITLNSTSVEPEVTPTPTPVVTPTPTPVPTPTPTPAPSYIGWEFNDGTEGWTGLSVDQVTNLHASNGCLNGNITGTDPFIKSAYGINMDITGKNTIKIRMKNSTSSTYAQIFFITNNDLSWGGAKVKTFDIVSNDQGYTEYVIDMSGVQGWTGALTQFRLDPNNDAYSGSFSIDYIRIS